jgi:DNA topoisomerase-2
MLDKMVENKEIKDFDGGNDKFEVNFTIYELPSGKSCTEDNMKLVKKLSTTNMVYFDEDNAIRKADSTSDIIEHFCTVRLPFYVKRKQKMIDELKTELSFKSNKARFIKSVIEDEMVLFNTTESGARTAKHQSEIESDLVKFKYDMHNGSYNYLIDLPFRSCTAETIAKLNDELANCRERLDKIESTTPKEMWLADLNELEKEITNYYKNCQSEKNERNKNTLKKTTRKIKSK